MESVCQLLSTTLQSQPLVTNFVTRAPHVIYNSASTKVDITQVCVSQQSVRRLFYAIPLCVAVPVWLARPHHFVYGCLYGQHTRTTLCVGACMVSTPAPCCVWVPVWLAHPHHFVCGCLYGQHTRTTSCVGACMVSTPAPLCVWVPIWLAHPHHFVCGCLYCQHTRTILCVGTYMVSTPAPLCRQAPIQLVHPHHFGDTVDSARSNVTNNTCHHQECAVTKIKLARYMRTKHKIPDFPYYRQRNCATRLDKLISIGTIVFLFGPFETTLK